MVKPYYGSIVEIAGQAWKLTHHALDRLVEMNIGGDQVRQCLAHPEEVTGSVKYPGTKHYRLGNFCLAVAFDGRVPTVVTALWATPEAWAADLVGCPVGDRQLRHPVETH